MSLPGVEIVCDFDGTVTRVDTVDLLLERLAEPAWQIFEERWMRGEIGSRECMAAQVALIRGGWCAVTAVLAEAALDPTFAPFAAWCHGEGIVLRVVSEGLDRVIEHLLGRESVVVDEVRASRLVERADGRFMLEFPRRPGWSCAAAVCKCALFPAGERRPTRILVGDGRSDFCCSARADFVLAGSRLAIHCRHNGIGFVPFEDFTGVRRFIEARRFSRGSARRFAAEGDKASR